MTTAVSCKVKIAAGVIMILKYTERRLRAKFAGNAEPFLLYHSFVT